MGPCQVVLILDVPPLSRAGSLLQWDFCLALNLSTPPIICGSELARDGAVSGDIDIGCATAIASGLTPTVGFLSGAELEYTADKL